jgi:hypothetical protein
MAFFCHPVDVVCLVEDEHRALELDLRGGEYLIIEQIVEWHEDDI